MAASLADQIVSKARGFLGVPYKWGGTSPSGFDCSGFVQYVYKQLGITLPRTSYQQMTQGVGESLSTALPGDLIFTEHGGHVGIYAGGGQWIEAPHTGDVVKVAPVPGGITAVRRVLPGYSWSGTVDTASLDVPGIGTIPTPGDLPSTSDVKKLALESVFVMGGIALVGLGFWRAVEPAAKKAAGAAATIATAAA